VWAFARAGGSLATGVMLSIWLAMTPSQAFASEQAPVVTSFAAASPLPRLFGSGAILPVTIGLGLGVGIAYLLSRRSSARASQP
jgi:hypothetical protein